MNHLKFSKIINKVLCKGKYYRRQQVKENGSGLKTKTATVYDGSRFFFVLQLWPRDWGISLKTRWVRRTSNLLGCKNSSLKVLSDTQLPKFSKKNNKKRGKAKENHREQANEIGCWLNLKSSNSFSWHQIRRHEIKGVWNEIRWDLTTHVQIFETANVCVWGKSPIKPRRVLEKTNKEYLSKKKIKDNRTTNTRDSLATQVKNCDSFRWQQVCCQSHGRFVRMSEWEPAAVFRCKYEASGLRFFLFNSTQTTTYETLSSNVT